MGKYSRSAVIASLAIALSAATACQKSEVANGSANASANKAAVNTSKTTNTAAASTTEVDLSSPTASYQTAYNARKNKDVPALKRVLAQDVQDFLTEMGKADDGSTKSLDDMLKELNEQPQAPSAESRNEKINGDKATLEYLNEQGGWSTMDFVKENGEWKMTIGEGDKPPSDMPKGTDKGKSKK